MVWNNLGIILYSSICALNNLQKQQNVALKCAVIGTHWKSIVPNSRLCCWDQGQEFPSPKFASNSEEREFLNSSWPQCLRGTTHGTHMEKMARATQWCISQGKVFPEEAAHGLAPHMAPGSPSCNAAMQSAMGWSPVIPIKERWGDCNGYRERLPG